MEREKGKREEPTLKEIINDPTLSPLFGEFIMARQRSANEKGESGRAEYFRGLKERLLRLPQPLTPDFSLIKGDFTELDTLRKDFLRALQLLTEAQKLISPEAVLAAAQNPQLDKFTHAVGFEEFYKGIRDQARDIIFEDLETGEKMVAQLKKWTQSRSELDRVQKRLKGFRLLFGIRRTKLEFERNKGKREKKEISPEEQKKRIDEIVERRVKRWEKVFGIKSWDKVLVKERVRDRIQGILATIEGKKGEALKAEIEDRKKALTEIEAAQNELVSILQTVCSENEAVRRALARALIGESPAKEMPKDGEETKPLMTFQEAREKIIPPGQLLNSFKEWWGRVRQEYNLPAWQTFERGVKKNGPSEFGKYEETINKFLRDYLGNRRGVWCVAARDMLKTALEKELIK